MDKQLMADLPSRLAKIRRLMAEEGADACLLGDNMNLYYATGDVFNGYYYIPSEGEPLFFIKRPCDFDRTGTHFIGKPEQIREVLEREGRPMPGKVMLEADETVYSEYVRLQAVFAPAGTGNATPLMKKARMVKTPWEIGRMRESARKHTEVYRLIPSLYRSGMTDLQLQYEIEKAMRENGSIGLFRSFGAKMECFMGTILAGDNAAATSPFDYALGGKGVPSSPIGAAGEVIKERTTVAVDMAGNYTEYISDMTRIFSVGELPRRAYDIHAVSVAIRDEAERTAGPGTPCADIYNMSMRMADEAGLASCFMGTVQQAKFVGHGIGLQINEMPVLAPRSKDLLQPGMIFAFEPKFIVGGVGAVGVEDSFLVTETGLERLTTAPDAILPLDGK